MKIYKFGGAAVNSAERITNLATILCKQGTEGLVLIVSAMGKTTNKIEQILSCFLQGKHYKDLLANLSKEFQETAQALFPSNANIFQEIIVSFEQLEATLQNNANSSYNFLYDQVVPFGELITVKLISAYLEQEGMQNVLLDARDYIQTDTTYRDATVHWAVSCQNIQSLVGRQDFFITQGFIAADKLGNTTTLGREGSDYSAAIFAYCLDATELSIWKDVPGVLNADPRYFKDTLLLEQVSFSEAIELAYYGASIIHPKTIQPLHSKKIPLRVRSFLEPEREGTTISEGQRLLPDAPCYILKKKQQLLQIASKDFSFIVEEDISDIFRILCENQMKVNLLHNSAISLSLCIDDRLADIQYCINALKKKYQVTHLKDVTLYTIRNYDESDFQKRFAKLCSVLRQTKDDVVHILVEDTP